MAIADSQARPLAFIREHGVVLVAAAGPAPRLTDAIVGAPVKGSWWAHPQGKHIFAILEAVKASPDILVCRMIQGKITLVHRRLWPQLVRLAARFTPEQLAQITERHTASGRHVSTAVPYPQWVLRPRCWRTRRMGR
ncbi:hypothetical protein LP419_32000 [Massilia sp. H-1]|nr:hypothetical protein LP419_32000 [Massilia sp. H-1]